MKKEKEKDAGSEAGEIETVKDGIGQVQPDIDCDAAKTRSRTRGRVEEEE